MLIAKFGQLTLTRASISASSSLQTENGPKISSGCRPAVDGSGPPYMLSMSDSSALNASRISSDIWLLLLMAHLGGLPAHRATPNRGLRCRAAVAPSAAGTDQKIFVLDMFYMFR
jgi:hypothetical protein